MKKLFMLLPITMLISGCAPVESSLEELVITIDTEMRKVNNASGTFNSTITAQVFIEDELFINNSILDGNFLVDMDKKEFHIYNGDHAYIDVREIEKWDNIIDEWDNQYKEKYAYRENGDSWEHGVKKDDKHAADWVQSSNYSNGIFVDENNWFDNILDSFENKIGFTNKIELSTETISHMEVDLTEAFVNFTKKLKDDVAYGLPGVAPRYEKTKSKNEVMYDADYRIRTVNQDLYITWDDYSELETYCEGKISDFCYAANGKWNKIVLSLRYETALNILYGKTTLQDIEQIKTFTDRKLA